MRKRSWALVAALLALALLLGGCAGPGEPVAGPTGEPLVEIAPQLGEDVQPGEIALVEQRDVSLYFRMLGEDALACESRRLWIPKDKLVEEMLVEALIAGPSTDMLELTGLFPQGTKVIKAWGNGDMLSVLLSRAFLTTPSDVPPDWAIDEGWRQEVYTRRRLALASIVGTITEETAYTSVQFLVADRDDDPTGRRLYLREMYGGDATDEQLLSPMGRNESLLLTHYNTALLILECWQSQEYGRMYRLLAQDSGERPTDEGIFAQMMAQRPRRLIGFWLSPGTVSEDGQSAVLEATYEYREGGNISLVENYPLRMVREQGLWKIEHSELLRMMEAI